MLDSRVFCTVWVEVNVAGMNDDTYAGQTEWLQVKKAGRNGCMLETRVTEIKTNHITYV